jgi:hypothetical protein
MEITILTRLIRSDIEPNLVRYYEHFSFDGVCIIIFEKLGAAFVKLNELIQKEGTLMWSISNAVLKL